MPKNLNAIIQKKNQTVIIKARKPKAASKNQHIILGSNPKESLDRKLRHVSSRTQEKKGKADKASDISTAISSSDLCFLINVL